MSKIRGKDTKPELLVRKRLFAEGWRFKVCDMRYPGKPDVVVPKAKTIIDVRGCFWHRHGCKDSTMPKSNVAFWMEKWSKNVKRDNRNEEAWREAGWNVIVVWQCALEGKRAERTLQRIIANVAAWAAEVVSGKARRVPHHLELLAAPKPRDKGVKTIAKIISGGQTGVDRGALEAALKSGFPYGGLVPRGRLAEDGVVPAKFDKMEESDSPDYRFRTRRNAEHSDATLILAFDEKLEGGTQRTRQYCMNARKPFFVDNPSAPAKDGRQLAVTAWLAKLCAKNGGKPLALNVAGPRESKSPGIGKATERYMRKLVEAQGQSQKKGTKNMKKPYVVCHMVQSIDGRIDCAMVDKISGDEYYDTLKTYKAPSYINGRVTMEHYWAAKTKFQPKSASPVGKPCAFVAEAASAYVFSCETVGSLMWTSNRVDNLPLVCVLSEKTSAEYLAYLKSKKISYIVTGKAAINLKKAMEVALAEFGVKRLALLGGGVLNGAFMKDGLVDEYSILVAPGIDGRKDRVGSFDGLPDVKRAPLPLALTGCKKLANGVVWLKYKPVTKDANK